MGEHLRLSWRPRLNSTRNSWWSASRSHACPIRVGDGEFAVARLFADHVLLSRSALGGASVAIAFRQRLAARCLT